MEYCNIGLILSLESRLMWVIGNTNKIAVFICTNNIIKDALATKSIYTHGSCPISPYTQNPRSTRVCYDQH